MPSLVDFSPLIGAGRDRGRGAEYMAQSTRDTLGAVADVIDTLGERGRQREKEFESVFDYDFNKNANKRARGYLVDKYRHIKRDAINSFMDSKDLLGRGKLTPKQKIEIEDSMDSFKREAELLNVTNKEIQNAEDIVSKTGHLKLDQKRINDYLSLIEPDENGKYNTEKMAEFLSSAKVSPTGQAFTEYIDFDPDFHLQQSKNALKKVIEPSVKTYEKTEVKDGRKVTKTYRKKEYGNEFDRRVAYLKMLSNSNAADMYEYRIGEQLSEDERSEAIAEFGTKVKNPMSAYYAMKKADMTGGFDAGEKMVKESTVPYTAKDGPASGVPNIEKTEIGWEFGTTPITISKDLDIITDEGVEKQTIKNGSIIAVEDRNGNSVTKIIVPRGKNEGLEQMLKNAQKSKGSLLTSDERREQIELMLNTDRYKTIEVPTESVYKELKTGFKKKKLNLEGFEDLTFNEAGEDGAVVRSKSKQDLVKDDWETFKRK